MAYRALGMKRLQGAPPPRSGGGPGRPLPMPPNTPVAGNATLEITPPTSTSRPGRRCSGSAHRARDGGVVDLGLGLPRPGSAAAGRALDA